MMVYLSRKLKLRYIYLLICLIGFIYIIYQIKSIQELAAGIHKNTPPVRGVHMALQSSYLPDRNNKFSCLSDKKLISFDKVNDDYCDCEDGSDEPGTEACPNGHFYCTHEINKRHALPIQSGRVNDGICDCCDGSDEWKKAQWSFTAPCIKHC